MPERNPIETARFKWDALLQFCEEEHVLEMMLGKFIRESQLIRNAMLAEREEKDSEP